MSTRKKTNDSIFSPNSNCDEKTNRKVNQNKKLFLTLVISSILMFTLFIIVGYYGSDSTVIIDNDDPNGVLDARVIYPEEFPEGDFPIGFNDTGDLVYASRGNLSFINVQLLGFTIVNDALLDLLKSNDTYKFQIGYTLLFNQMLTPFFTPINQNYRHEMISSFQLFRDLSSRSDELYGAYGNVANVYGDEDSPNSYPCSVKVKMTSGLNIIPFAQLSFVMNDTETYEIPCVWGDFMVNPDLAKIPHGFWRITLESFTFNATQMLDFVTAIKDISQGNSTRMQGLTASGLSFNATPERGFWLGFDELLTPVTDYSLVPIT